MIDLADELRVLDGELEGDAATDAEAEDVDLFEAEVSEHGDDVRREAGALSGRSMSFVRPWPWKSSATTRRPADSTGINAPNCCSEKPVSARIIAPAKSTLRHGRSRSSPKRSPA